MSSRALSAVATILLAVFSLTACNSNGSSPLAALDDNAATTVSLNSLGASTQALSGVNADMNDILETMQADLLNDISGVPRGPRPAQGSPSGSPVGVDTSKTRPEAVLEVSRRPNALGSTTSGGAASARFNSALGVQGVSVNVLGTNYTLVTPPLRSRGTTQTPPPSSTNANASRQPRIAETLFVYPLPPSSTATTQPSLITLSDAAALATFTVAGYTLGDNSIQIPGTITVTSAKEGDNVSRSAALTVRWNVSGSFTNGVLSLRNVPDSAALAGKSRSEAEKILRSLPKPIVKQLSVGATSVELSATEMASLQAGNAHLSLSVANVKRTNTDKAVLKADSHTGIKIRLQ